VPLRGWKVQVRGMREEGSFGGRFRINSAIAGSLKRRAASFAFSSIATEERACFVTSDLSEVFNAFLRRAGEFLAK